MPSTSTRSVVGLPFLLSLRQQAVASPVPEIFPPEAGTLSFAELAQKAFFQILELGFLRGVLVSLLILGLLVFLLVGSLRALALYLNQHDPKLWEPYEEIDDFEDEWKEADQLTDQQTSVVMDRSPCLLRHQRRMRGSRYIIARPSTPVTRINIHCSPRRATTIASIASPLKSRSDNIDLCPMTPLRCALSKASPSLGCTSGPQSSFSSPTRNNSSTTSTPSPKSVRWADEIHLSVISTVKMSVQRERMNVIRPDAEPGMDITTGMVASRSRCHSDLMNMFPSSTLDAEPLPAYEALVSRPIVVTNLSGCHPDIASPMQLEGDTS